MQRSIHKKVLTLVVALLAAMFVMVSARSAKADTYGEIQLYGGEWLCPPHMLSCPGQAFQLCLDTEGNASQPLYINECSGAASQQFAATYMGLDSHNLPEFSFGQTIGGTFYLVADALNGTMTMQASSGTYTVWQLTNGTLYSENQVGYCVQTTNGATPGYEAKINNGCYAKYQDNLAWFTTANVGPYMYFRAGANTGPCLFTQSTGVLTSGCTNSQGEEWYLSNQNHLCSDYGGGCVAINTSNGSLAIVAPGTSGYDFQWEFVSTSATVGMEIANPDYSLCLQYSTGGNVVAAACGGSDELWLPELGHY